MQTNTTQPYTLDDKSLTAFFTALRQGEPKIVPAVQFLKQACSYFHLSQEEIYKMLTGDGKIALKEIQAGQNEADYLASHVSGQHNWRIFMHYANLSSFSKDLMAQWRNILRVDDDGLKFMFSRSPRVFFIPVDQALHTIEETVKRFQKSGLTRSQFVKAILNNPAILAQDPNKIETNVRESVAFLREQNPKIDVDKYLQIALKQAGLFYMTAGTLKKNFERNQALFESQGLSKSDFVKALSSFPRFLETTPENILAKIEGAVAFFGQYGISKAQYLQMALNQSALFATEPDRIKRNIQQVVEKYKDLGLTTQTYMQAVLKTPRLLAEPPQTIIPRIESSLQNLTETGIASSKSDALSWIIKNSKAIVFGNDAIQRRQIVALLMKDAGKQPKPSLFKGENSYVRDRICEVMKVSVGSMQQKVREQAQKTGQKLNSKLENEAIIDTLIQQKAQQLSHENAKQFLQWRLFYGKHEK